MSDDRTNLRKYADAGRPLIEQWIDIGEEFKAIRDAARNDGIDWASVKALIKAQILDSREGTDKRVKAIIEKADFASAYADMLGMSNNLSADKITRAREPSGNPGELPQSFGNPEQLSAKQSSGNPGQLASAPEKPADAIARAPVTVNHSPAKTPSDARNVANPRLAIPDDLSPPPFLDRRTPAQEATS